MATFSDFKAKFPILVCPADANQTSIQLCLDEAAVMINLQKCPTFSDLLQLYYAAHCLIKSGGDPEGGDDSIAPLSSVTVGGVSTTFAINASKDGLTYKDYYNSTVYGAKYLLIYRKCFGSGAMTAP